MTAKPVTNLKELITTENGVFYFGDSFSYLSSRSPQQGEYILTDPPWGHGKKINAAPGGKWGYLKASYKPVNWNNVPNAEHFKLITFYPYIVWGANYFYWNFPSILPFIWFKNREKKPPQDAEEAREFIGEHSKNWIIWNKKKPDTISFCGYELAYANLGKDKDIDTEVIPWLHNGLAKEDPIPWRREVMFHPAQKPVGLWMAILKKYIPDGAIVIDPFAGSCSLAVACEKLNALGARYRWVCIESNPEYSGKAVEWIKDYLRNGRLFA